MEAVDESLCDSCESELETFKSAKEDICESCKTGEKELCDSCESNLEAKTSEKELCDSCNSEVKAFIGCEKDLCDECNESVAATSFGASSFTTFDLTNDTELDMNRLAKHSNNYIKSEQQRELAQVEYYRELIQQQMVSYQKLRLEEERFEHELASMKEYSKELDQTIQKVWTEAQEAVEKDALFRKTYNVLMDQEEPQIKQTAQYLRQTVPVRDELFGTLCVTSQTEKHAVENAADLQMDYRRRIKDSLQVRTRLNQKLRTSRQQFDKSQEQKRTSYDQILKVIEEIDQLDSAHQLLRIEKLTAN